MYNHLPPPDAPNTHRKSRNKRSLEIMLTILKITDDAGGKDDDGGAPAQTTTVVHRGCPCTDRQLWKCCYESYTYSM